MNNEHHASLFSCSYMAFAGCHSLSHATKPLSVFELHVAQHSIGCCCVQHG